MINSILISAVLFRLRGSAVFADWTGRGATTARLVWSGHLALTAWLVGMDGLASGIVWAWLLWAGLMLGAMPFWPGSLGVRTWWEVGLHSARGLLWTAPAAWVLAWGGYVGWTGVAALCGIGLACGPVYWLCRTAWPRKATELAELVWGGMIAAAVLISLK